MIETEQNTIVIEQDENEELITKLLESMYTGKLVITTSNVVPFLLIAEKYLMTLWIPKLADYLSRSITLENAIQCLKLLNLEIYPSVKHALRQKANHILEAKSYLSFTAEQFITLIEVLTNATNGMKGIEALLSWIAHDEEERAGYSLAITRVIHLATCNSAFKFDPNYCSKSMILSKNYTKAKSSSLAAVLGTKTSIYKIRVTGTHVMVGFAQKKEFNKSGGNQYTCAYFLYLHKGTLHSHTGEAGTPFCKACNSSETIIDVKLEDNCISYTIDGGKPMVAYENVFEELHPAFEIHNSNCSIEFIE
jgi:hypothetical protein